MSLGGEKRRKPRSQFPQVCCNTRARGRSVVDVCLDLQRAHLRIAKEALQAVVRPPKTKDNRHFTIYALGDELQKRERNERKKTCQTNSPRNGGGREASTKRRRFGSRTERRAHSAHLIFHAQDLIHSFIATRHKGNGGGPTTCTVSSERSHSSSLHPPHASIVSRPCRRQ